MDVLEVNVALNKIDLAENNTFSLKTLVRSYAEHHNYSIKLFAFSEVNNMTSMDLVLVDLGNLIYNPFILTSVVPFHSVSILIPALNKLDKSKYFAMPFDTTIWIVCALFPIYFAAALEISLRKSRIIRNTVEAVRAIATGIIRLPSSAGFLLKTIYFLAIFFGFSMSLIYTSFLGCFLTKTIDKSDYDIVCTADRIKQLDLDPKRQDIKFLVHSSDDYFMKLFDLDMSNGYCMTSFFWSTRIDFKRYMKPAFRPIIPWKFAYVHLLRINKHSRHVENFNSYLLNVYSSGFMSKWGSEMLLLNKLDKIRQSIEIDDNILTFRDLIVIFKLYVFCLILSLVVFVGEICYEFLRKLRSINRT